MRAPYRKEGGPDRLKSGQGGYRETEHKYVVTSGEMLGDLCDAAFLCLQWWAAPRTVALCLMSVDRLVPVPVSTSTYP